MERSGSAAGAAAQSLCDLLEAAARRHGERVAVVAPDGSSLTYAELEARAAAIAGFLRARGVQPGDRVGFCLPKGTASVAVLFGAMKARAAYVPVDWHGPAARNATIHRAADVAALFLGEARADVLREWPSDALPKTLVRVPMGRTGSAGAHATVVHPFPDGAQEFEAALRHAPLAPDGAGPRRRDDLAYLLFTSGSTGVPKGVALTQENALSFVDWGSEVFAPTCDDRFSSHAPFHFDLSVFDLFVALKHGATLFLIGEELGKEPKGLARFIAEKRLTIWYSTPSALALLAEFGNLPALDLSALRHVLFAGEVFPVKTLRRLTELLPAPAYWNLYGPTETNVCTFARIPLPIAADRTEPFPIGPLCSHCEGLLLDDAGAPVAAGEEGRLHIAGPALFRGYFGRQDLDAKCFHERDGKRWYDTGDVVREEPGLGFRYLGRRDRMVKRRGYRIELGEVEAALQRHPELREAAVVALPDPAAGVRIDAHLAPVGAPLSLIALKRYCAEQLPAAMSPDRFHFHAALPRTSTAKVDYPALLRASAAASP
ncbi:MAG: amino acid adenylation domain-containing protein [Planctomycetes bacterium]|nr:amino acid adenylation domain-containing protein [Planctomycetota bacterium]